MVEVCVTHRRYGLILDCISIAMEYLFLFFSYGMTYAVSNKAVLIKKLYEDNLASTIQQNRLPAGHVFESPIRHGIAYK